MGKSKRERIRGGKGGGEEEGGVGLFKREG